MPENSDVPEIAVSDGRTRDEATGAFTLLMRELDTLHEKIDGVNTSVTRLSDRIDGTRLDVSDLKSDLKAEVAATNAAISAQQQDVLELKSDLKEVKKNFETVDIKQMNKDVDTLKHFKTMAIAIFGVVQFFVLLMATVWGSIKDSITHFLK